MKKLFVVLVCLGFGLSSSTTWANGRTVDKAQVEKVQVGMSESQVRDILGEPAKVEEDVKLVRGGKDRLERKTLTYKSSSGADDKYFIYINKQDGKVYKVTLY